MGTLVLHNKDHALKSHQAKAISHHNKEKKKTIVPQFSRYGNQNISLSICSLSHSFFFLFKKKSKKKKKKRKGKEKKEEAIFPWGTKKSCLADSNGNPANYILVLQRQIMGGTVVPSDSRKGS